MVAREPRDGEKKDEQHEASNDKSRNGSTLLHRFNDLTAEGRSGRTDGRAKSPVLNASALAVVKIAACVSCLTLRAAVRLRCALAISG